MCGSFNPGEIRLEGPTPKDVVDVGLRLFDTPSWVLIVGIVLALAAAIAVIATVGTLLMSTLRLVRRVPRPLDPKLGFELSGVDLEALRRPGRAALARSASGRELKRREKLVDRVLSGTSVIEASRRARVTEAIARQWISLYLDSSVSDQIRGAPALSRVR